MVDWWQALFWEQTYSLSKKSRVQGLLPGFTKQCTWSTLHSPNHSVHLPYNCLTDTRQSLDPPRDLGNMTHLFALDLREIFLTFF